MEKKNIKDELKKVILIDNEIVINNLKNAEINADRKTKTNAETYINADKCLKTSLDNFNKDLIKNPNINKISLDLIKNEMSINVSSYFVFNILTIITKCDYNKVKDKFPIALKEIVSDNVNKNSNLFLNYLL